MFAINAVAPSPPPGPEPVFDPHEDIGCEVAPTCLHCPLPRCKFDDIAWYNKYRRMAQDLHMAAIIHDEGLSVAEAAARFAITRRTVFRVLNRCRDAMQELTPAEAAAFAGLASWQSLPPISPGPRRQ